MNKLFLLATLCVPALLSAQLDFDTAIDVVGKRISFKIYEQEKTKVAVANLVDHLGEANELGGLISEEMTVSLLKHSRGFEVMDRAHLQAIIEEHKLALGGLMNDSTIIELGRLESVQVVITGTVVRLGKKYKVTMKALDTQSGMVIAADREYFVAEKYLDDYYGLDSGTPDPHDPDPDPDPVKPPLSDCATGNHGTVYIKNQKDHPVMVTLECNTPGARCKDKITFEVAAGATNHVRGICAGNVNFMIKNPFSREEITKGTLYMKACAERAIKI